jgi:hypothetical protein
MLNAGPWSCPFAPNEGQKAWKSGRSQNEGIPEVSIWIKLLRRSLSLSIVSYYIKVPHVSTWGQYCGAGV